MNKDFKKQAVSVSQIEQLLGYKSKQFGGIRKYLVFLTRQGALCPSSKLTQHPTLFEVNIKKAESLFEKSIFYQICYNYEIENYYHIPIPTELSEKLNSNVNKGE
jgi:hypothetical protein